MSALFADGTLAKTADEAAVLIGATERQLLEAVKARRIPHRRLSKNRGVVFTREDLESFLGECLVETATTMAVVTPMPAAPARKRRTAA